MNDIHSLSHTKWNCKCHIVFAPKYRRSHPVYGSQVNYPMQVVVVPTPLGVAGILRATPDG